MLQNLCFRYSLIALAKELSFLDAICIRASAYQTDPDEDTEDEYFETAFADTKDARTVLQAYIARLGPSSCVPFPRRLALLLIGVFRPEIILKQFDWMPLLIKNSCLWIWAELDAATYSPEHPSHDFVLIKYATRTFEIIRCVCRSTLFCCSQLSVLSRLYAEHMEARTATISAFTKALAESDFVNLFGMMVLLPLSVGSTISKISSSKYKLGSV
jgi:hypothetical protein